MKSLGQLGDIIVYNTYTIFLGSPEIKNLFKKNYEPFK